MSNLDQIIKQQKEGIVLETENYRVILLGKEVGDENDT